MLYDLLLSEVCDFIYGWFVLGDRQEIQEVKNAYMAYGEVRTKIKGNISKELHEPGAGTWNCANDNSG